MSFRKHVIIGFGAAGAEAAEAIRRRDPDARVTIFNAEPYPFYFRPALSYYFKGALGEEGLLARPPHWARRRRIRILNDTVREVRLHDREVVGESGLCEPYDELLIATGARPFKAPWIGADLDGVVTYRGLVCARKTMDHVKKRRVRRAVVVGGGMLGVEMAENFKSLGLETALLVREERPLSLLFDEEGSGIIRERMEKDGVRVLVESEVDEFLGDSGAVEGVRLKSGETLEADIAAVAIGVRPVVDFLEGSGVELAGGGVVVDEYLKTSAEGVWAAGDAAMRRMGERLIPCRTWLAAGRMGAAAGANMAGAGEPFDEGVFFNASHAYDVMYALVGRFGPREGDGVRGVVLDSPPGTRAKVMFEGNKVIGGMFVGYTDPALAALRAVEKGLEADPAALSGSGWRSALSAAGPPMGVF